MNEANVQGKIMNEVMSMKKFWLRQCPWKKIWLRYHWYPRYLLSHCLWWLKTTTGKGNCIGLPVVGCTLPTETIQTIVSIWQENMLGYLSADIICSEERTVFQEHSLRKTVSFEEQIMSKDKYPSIFFAPNGDYRVYYPSNLLRNARSFENWGIFSDILQL